MLFVCIDTCAYYRLSELEERIKYPPILLLYLFIWGRIFLRFVCEFYMCECFTCMLAYAPHACLVPMEVGRDQKIPWTRVKDGWESLCRCWESILGPLKEQQLILTSAPSSLPQRHSLSLNQNLHFPLDWKPASTINPTHTSLGAGVINGHRHSACYLSARIRLYSSWLHTRAMLSHLPRLPSSSPSPQKHLIKLSFKKVVKLYCELDSKTNDSGFKLFSIFFLQFPLLGQLISKELIMLHQLYCICG